MNLEAPLLATSPQILATFRLALHRPSASWPTLHLHRSGAYRDARLCWRRLVGRGADGRFLRCSASPSQRRKPWITGTNLTIQPPCTIAQRSDYFHPVIYSPSAYQHGDSRNIDQISATSNIFRCYLWPRGAAASVGAPRRPHQAAAAQILRTCEGGWDRGRGEQAKSPVEVGSEGELMAAASLDPVSSGSK